MSVTKAYEMPGKILSGSAAADFTAVKYLAMVRNANGDFAIAGAGAAITGVQQDSVNIGQTMGVMVNGVSFVKLGGTVAPGAQVEVGAAGVFITKASGIAVGVCEVGGAVGEIGCILIK